MCGRSPFGAGLAHGADLHLLGLKPAIEQHLEQPALD
jgi:hypothetical protein